MVNLGNVDNTTDLAKEISTKTATALSKPENTISVQLPLKRANAINAGGDLVTDFSIDSTADVTLNTSTLNGNLAVSGFYSVKPGSLSS